ncbi:MAG: NADH-quinone oxidoreductase subunit H [Acidimicrobiales bacterium]
MRGPPGGGGGAVIALGPAGATGSVALAVAGVGVAALAGAWVVGVLDDACGRAVAGRPLRLAEVAAAPLRRAALLVLQGRTTTERPDSPDLALGAGMLGALAATTLVIVPLSSRGAAGDVDSGIVLFGAAMALVMVAVFLHGWSSNSVMPLVGGYRFVAQALSYEMPLALVLIGVALPARSLAVGRIVASQHGVWNVVRQPLGLPLFLVAGVGLAFWSPLDTPDAADLAGGTAVEAAGTALLVWEASRALVLVAVAAMGAAAFLGGWQGPLLPGPVWVVGKTVALLVVLVAGGHVLARVRLERFVVVAWAVLIPVALVDVFAGGVVALATR